MAPIHYKGFIGQQVILQICSDEEKLIYILDHLSVSKRSPFYIFGLTIPLKHLLCLMFEILPCGGTTMLCFYIYIYTVGTESIQTLLNFSLFVILQPFAKII